MRSVRLSGDVVVRSQPVPLDVRAWRLLWRELIEYLRRGLGLEIPRDVGLYLLDAGQLAYRTGWSPMAPSRVLGCCVNWNAWNARSSVLVDQSLSLELASEVLAHELAHVWQARHCPREQSEAMREGFAQWVAFRYCASKGFARQQHEMRQRDGVKGQGLRRLLAIEHVLGSPAIVARVRSARRLREVAGLS